MPDPLNRRSTVTIVNPSVYLTDVLTRLVNGHLQSRLSELTPWGWKAASAAT